MKDVNLPLRRAYYAALSGISYNSAEVKSYYGEKPTNSPDDNYIIFSSINSSDASTKSSADTQTLIQVKIFTKKEIYNPGNANGEITDQVFQRVYPQPGNTLSLDPDFQLVSTRLVTDREDEIQMSAQVKYVDRTLIFSHRILHR